MKIINRPVLHLQKTHSNQETQATPEIVTTERNNGATNREHATKKMDLDK